MSTFQRLSALGNRSQFTQALTPATLVGIALVPVLAYTFKSYQKWRSMGRGGLPYNIFGFAIQGIFQLVARWDTIDESPFSNPKIIARFEPYGNDSFLGPESLPTRAGSRPTIPQFAAPQRQVTEQGSEAMIAKMKAYIEETAAANSGTLVAKPSKLEGGFGPALFLADESHAPDYLYRMKGEMVHVHLEGSSHITVSVSDAKEAVRKEWGQRFRLGGMAGIPWTYIIIYAPRNDEEYEIWKRFVAASIKFVTAGGPNVTLV